MKDSRICLLLILATLLPALAVAPLGAQTPCDNGKGRLDDLQSREQLGRFVGCALEHIETVGQEQAFADFQNSRDWLDGSVYLFAGFDDGEMLFIAGSDTPPGSNLWDLQDSDGYYIMRAMQRIVANYGAGYVHYRNLNRNTGQEEPKFTWVTRIEVAGAPAILGAGVHPLDAHDTCPADRVRASLAYGEADVERLVNCAAHFLQEHGLRAVHAFNREDPRWTSDPVYIFMLDMDGIVIANGGNPELVGQDNSELGDPDGIQMVSEMQRLLAMQDDGYIYYRYPNPATGAVEPKASYVRRVLVDGQPYILGAGRYVATPECRARPLAREIDTRAEMEQFVSCARRLVEERGEAAFDLFLNHPQWIGGATYLFVENMETCRSILYPLDYRADEVGCGLEDAEGVLIYRGIIGAATSEAGSGWTSYLWLNPASGMVEKKHAYVTRATLNGQTVAVGAGLYESELLP